MTACEELDVCRSDRLSHRTPGGVTLQYQKWHRCISKLEQELGSRRLSVFDVVRGPAFRNALGVDAVLGT